MKEDRSRKALYDKERKKDLPLYAERIEDRRKEKGISQKELAALCGISESSLSNYVSGNSTPSALALKEIAIALDISVDYLLDISPISERDLDAKAINKLLGLSEDSISILKQLQRGRANFPNVDATLVSINILLANSDIVEILSPIADYIASVELTNSIEKEKGFIKGFRGIIQIGGNKEESKRLQELYDIHTKEVEEVQPLSLYKIQKRIISYLEQYASKL